MKFTRGSRTKSALMALLLIAAAVVPLLSYAPRAHAASLGEVMVRFDRMLTNTPTTGTVCATPTTTATEAKVMVSFPTGYTLGAAATFTVDTTTNIASWPTGATAWPSIATATNVTSQDVTFPSGDLTVGTLYCFNWINSAAVKTNAAANTYTGAVTTQTVTPTNIDTAQYATATITNDQIVVSATVPAAFSFSLSGNTDSLTLTSSAVTAGSSPRYATVSTNAKNGWMVWAKDANTGLLSGTASHTIASTTPGTNSTLSSAAEGYNTGVTTSAGTGAGSLTVATAFVGGSLGKGGGLDTTLRPLVTSSGPNGGSTVTLTNNASITATTPAANDYTDTITVIGAGLF